MPTIKEVSKLAGVSLATVSRVINDSDRVKDETRKRVQEAMVSLGYTPNTAAQSLAGSRSNMLGMIVSWLDGPFYGPVMAAVEEELRRHKKHVLIASGHGNIENEKEAIAYLKARQVDGLILLTECLDRAYLETLSQDMPIYLVNQHPEGFEDRYVWLDHELGSYEATRYMIQQGHTKLVCVAGQQQKQDACERVAGFRRAMREAGLLVTDAQIKHTSFDIPGGVAAMNMVHQQGVEYTGVVAGNDELAVGVMEWLRQQHINVPEDVSVIGFDNQLLTNYVSPRLTTMNFPAYEMAKESAHLAVREIYFKDPPKGKQFWPSLVIRQSVSKPKTSN
ncbi:MAG: LacI family DNA-binding transcriptional regulator [Reinekea sp.]|jgi:LacI family transcriptional regulator